MYVHKHIVFNGIWLIVDGIRPPTLSPTEPIYLKT